MRKTATRLLVTRRTCVINNGRNFKNGLDVIQRYGSWLPTGALPYGTYVYRNFGDIPYEYKVRKKAVGQTHDMPEYDKLFFFR